jgi:superfamily II DNA or RNA helicase
MRLRPYQETCVGQVLAKWQQHKRLLAVLPTGAGKTIIFSHLADRMPGKSLIIAHREELLNQAISKLESATGLKASLERADAVADRNSKVVVGSIQTLMRRYSQWDPHHFDQIIIDETHHVAADSYQSVLRHFADAKVLGVTATPDRADQRSLGDHFDDVAFEITLPELIKDGYLAPIRVRVCDVSIDLSKVAIRGGDFDACASADALEPVLSRIIEQIQQFGKKKVLVFLPLVSTSKQMQTMMMARGINARHVDGESENRQETLEWFRTSTHAVLCNAMLLTEGYDEPSIDTIVCLRPTKSRALYTQIVGRGTRICEGKDQLLILDFLWMTGRHRLVRPTSLFAEGEVAEIADKLTSQQGEFDIETAVEDARKERERKLAEELSKKKRFAGRMIDPLEWAMATADESVVDYEPTMRWHQEPISEKQSSLLASFGFDPRKVENRGHASVLIDSVMSRGKRELATPKQVRLLIRMGHKHAARYSKQQASELINKICKKSSSPATQVRPAVSPA